MLTTTWDANTVAQMTDVLVPQIDVFVRVGLIEPSHEASRRGVSRRYDLRRVFEIAVAGELLAAGITVVQINGALRVLRQEWLHLCNPKTRRSVGVLVLWRTPNDRRQTPATVSPRIGPAKRTAATGRGWQHDPGGCKPAVDGEAAGVCYGTGSRVNTSNVTPPRYDDLPILVTPDDARAFLQVSKGTIYELLRTKTTTEPAVRQAASHPEERADMGGGTFRRSRS